MGPAARPALTNDLRTAAAPFALLALLGPTLAVAQYRWLAVAVALGLASSVLAFRRAANVWPWPRGGAAAVVAALLGWLGISALWAAEPGRALATAVSLGGFALLGAAAARATASAARSLDTAGMLAAGVMLGATLAAVDQLTGHALRAAIRGLAVAPPTLGFGLKPALSMFAVLLPVVAWLPGPARSLRLLALVATVVALWLVSAEAARLAALAGLLAAWLTARFGRALPRLIAGATALVILTAPLLAAAVLPRLAPLDAWPASAAHRVLIWDFAVGRIAERPLFGWGGEAARTIPGGRDTFAPAVLDRFGLTSPQARGWFGRPDAQRLPLHAHNMALQLWLELGVVGAVLAAWLVWVLGAAAARHGPAGAGAYAAIATVGALSFGVWQEWWWGVVLLVTGLLAAQRAANAPNTSSSAG